MKRILLPLAFAGSALALAACGAVQDAQSVLGTLDQNRNKDPLLSTNPPLSVPPGYGLRPPTTPTSSRASGETARKSRTVLKVPEADSRDGRPVPIQGRSQGETELLKKAGRTPQTSSIVRKTLNIESDRENERERRFVDKLLNYDTTKTAADSADGARDARLSPPVIKRRGEF